MELWRKVFRTAIVPLVSLAGLRALYEALERDDQRIMQGATTSPPPVQAVQDWPWEQVDALTFMLVTDNDATTVGDAEESFARACFEIDQTLGEPAGCRHYLNWYDETPRNEMRWNLMGEIPKSMEIKKEMMR